MALSSKQIQTIMGNLLLTGTLISSIIVLIGGVLFLIAHGHSPLDSQLFNTEPMVRSNRDVWRFAFSFTPLGIVQLGLLLLVLIQLVRVGLLFWFYLSIKDYYFTVFSLFILFVLLYSLFWRVV